MLTHFAAGGYRTLPAPSELEAARLQRHQMARGLAFGAPISLSMWLTLIWLALS